MKKHLLKIFGSTIGVVSTLATTFSFVSCSNLQNRFSAIGGNLDREFNVSQATYNALQNQFILKLQNKLQQEHVDPYQTALEIDNLRKSFKNIHNKYEINKDYSFSLLSTMLVEKARRQYGIKLVTESSAQWSDINKVFYGMRDSFDSYMNALRFPKEVKRVILERSWDEFQNLLYDDSVTPARGIKTQYDDPLIAMIKIRPLLISCFSDTNKEIALASATIKLQQFFDNYSVQLKNDKNVRLDLLEGKLDDKGVEFKEGNDISGFADKIFNVTRLSDNQTISFKDACVMPGYKISPVLQSISRDEYSNLYSLNIDWTCEKTTYLDKAKTNVVAHLYSGSQTITTDDLLKKDFSISELLDFEHPQTINYQIRLTPEKEVKTLKKVYLNKDIDGQYLDYLDFKWDDNGTTETKCYFDPFLQGKKAPNSQNSKNETYFVNMDQLADSGLMVAKCRRGNNCDNAENQYVRLDKYISNNMFDLSKEHEQKSNEKMDSLLAEFVENCNLFSETTIDSSASVYDNHAKSILKVAYKNSEENLDTVVTIDKSFEHTNYGVSGTSYYWLTSQYNQYANFVDFYNGEPLKEELSDLENAKDEHDLALGLSSFLNALLVLDLFLNPFKTWAIISMLVATLVSETCMILTDYFFTVYKYNPLKDFSNRMEKLRYSTEGSIFLDMINRSAADMHLLKANDYLCIDAGKYRDNEKLFKTQSFERINECVQMYQGLIYSPEFSNFNEKISQLDITPKKYEDIEKDWKPHHKWWRVNLSLEIISAAADSFVLVLSLLPCCLKSETQLINNVNKANKEVTNSVNKSIAKGTTNTEKAMKQINETTFPSTDYHNNWLKSKYEANNVSPKDMDMVMGSGSREWMTSDKEIVVKPQGVEVKIYDIDGPVKNTLGDKLKDPYLFQADAHQSKWISDNIKTTTGENFSIGNPQKWRKSYEVMQKKYGSNLAKNHYDHIDELPCSGAIKNDYWEKFDTQVELNVLDDRGFSVMRSSNRLKADELNTVQNGFIKSWREFYSKKPVKPSTDEIVDFLDSQLSKVSSVEQQYICHCLNRILINDWFNCSAIYYSLVKKSIKIISDL